MLEEQKFTIAIIIIGVLAVLGLLITQAIYNRKKKLKLLKITNQRNTNIDQHGKQRKKNF